MFSAEVHSFDINQEPILETVKNRQNDSNIIRRMFSTLEEINMKTTTEEFFREYTIWIHFPNVNWFPLQQPGYTTTTNLIWKIIKQGKSLPTIIISSFDMRM